jgi:hypothetical protein
MLNLNFQGSNGTWTSRNPMVMYISQTGYATAITPVTAIIRYTSPGGVAFSEWIMYVKLRITDRPRANSGVGL